MIFLNLVIIPGASCSAAPDGKFGALLEAIILLIVLKEF